MRPRVDGLRLAVAFLRHRAAQAAVLVLMGFVLGGTVIGLAVVRSSAEQAILDSVRADLGQKSYVLQTGNPDAIKVLSGVDGITPIQDQMGAVVMDGLSSPVLVRATTSSSLELGVVTRGTRPKHAGEVLLSESTAESLGIAIGDTVQVRTGDAETLGRVVGFSVDPANRTTSTLVQLVDDSTEFQPTMWLSDADFYANPALQPILERRTAIYHSVENLLEMATENRPQFLSSMRFVPAGAGLLIGVVLVSVSTGFSRRWRTDVDALVAAGMAPAHAWRRLLSIVFGTVLVGEILGASTAAVALMLSRGPVSAWVGQHWVRIAFPWQEAATVLGLTILSALLAMPVVAFARRWAKRLTPRPARRRWVTPLAALVVGAGFAVWVVLIRTPGNRAAVLAPLAGTLIAAIAPFVIAPLLCWGLPTATRSLLRHLAAGLRSVAAVGAIVALLSSIWSAQTMHSANIGEAMSSPLEPAGSFVISEMPDAAIPTLTNLYRSHGGNEVVQFRIPDESLVRPRVTGTKVITCMSEQRTMDPVNAFDCFPEKAVAPINRVMLGQPGSIPHADPYLLENGKVGLLLFDSSDGTASRLAETHAEADLMLGGNLPGLVVPPDSNVAKEFGLTPGGSSEVVLLDFYRLTSHDQFVIRAAAIRLAPSAQTSSGTDPTAYDRLRSTANTVGFLGATAAMVVILLGGVSLAVAHSTTRQALIDVGSASGARWGIVARWTAVPAITAGLTIPLALFTVSSGGQNMDASYGTLWILPGLTGMAASFIVGVAFLRAPQRASE